MSQSQPIVIAESENVTECTNDVAVEIDMVASDVNCKAQFKSSTSTRLDQAEGGHSTKSMEIPVIDITELDDLPKKGLGFPRKKP